jgi:hypothetical protein
MSYRSGRKEGDGDFLLVISGSARDASYLTGWREFKDHIRKVVKEQPGWVEVYASRSQKRGDMEVWARLRDKEDADAAYSMSSLNSHLFHLTDSAMAETYSQPKGMLIHIWETCRSNEGFEILRCNCSSNFPGVSEGCHSVDLCGIDIGRVSNLPTGSRQTRPTHTTSYPSSQPLHNYKYPTSRAYAVPTIYSSYRPPAQMPVYSANSYGIPVNVRNGAVLTEARGIFLQNLSYRCTPSDLYSLLLTVGQPVDYKLLRDARTGVFKGSATAAFGSQHLAVSAAHYLNGVEHMGMKLIVRMDKETTAVGQTAPLIVGSDMYIAPSRVGLRHILR